MSVDWSEAPEGATHWDGPDLGFMRPSLTAVNWDYFAIGDKWTFYGQINDQMRRDMIARPATWNGKGFPPAGTICEVMPHNDVWGFSTCEPRNCLVLAYHQDFVWVDTGEDGVPVATRTDKVEFRLIRTVEQIAADERLHKVRNALTAVNSKVSFPDDVASARSSVMVATIEAMIDAGYSKSP